MRTQLIQEPPVGVARLECYPAAGGQPEWTVLESFPFTIGRSSSVDFQIPSSRVSREHATIVKQGANYLIRDPGSTNGTFLNGKRVAEGVLHDGDLLTFGDAEYTFFTGEKRSRQDTVTQVIERDQQQRRDEVTPKALVREVRRVHEMLTHRCLVALYQPIAQFAPQGLFGYEASAEEDDSGPVAVREVMRAAENRLTTRLRWLGRTVAVEEARLLPQPGSLLVRLHAAEIGANWLIGSIRRLASIVGESRRLIVAVPESALQAGPYFSQWRAELDEAGVDLACDEFSCRAAQVRQLKPLAPDLLVLAPNACQAAFRSPEQRRLLQATVHAARELGSQVLATGIASKEQSQLAAELGCTLGKGAYFGGPQPLYALAAERDGQIRAGSLRGSATNSD